MDGLVFHEFVFFVQMAVSEWSAGFLVVRRSGAEKRVKLLFCFCSAPKGEFVLMQPKSHKEAGRRHTDALIYILSIWHHLYLRLLLNVECDTSKWSFTCSASIALIVVIEWDTLKQSFTCYWYGMDGWIGWLLRYIGMVIYMLLIYAICLNGSYFL